MEILLGMLYAISAIFLVLCIRPITTFVHEMGHAIPALLFTDGEVIIYVGSYGDINQSTLIDYGRLKIYFRLNLFHWDLGLCSHHAYISLTQHLIIVLGGPFLSLIFATLLFLQMISGTYSDGAITIMSLFIISSTWDFAINMIPRSEPLVLHDQSLAYNDGAQIKRLLSMGSSAADYAQTFNTFKQTGQPIDYERLLKIIEQKNYPPIMVDETSHLLVAKAKYQDALDLFQEYHNRKNLKTHQYLLLGQIYQGLGNAHEAIKAYEQYWFYHHNDPNTLNKKAAVLMDIGQYEVAAEDIRISLSMQPEGNVSALLNRVRYYLSQHALKEAKQDLEQIEKLVPENANLFYYWGRYHEEKWNYQAAIHYLEKAKAAGSEQHALDYKIEELQQMLER